MPSTPADQATATPELLAQARAWLAQDPDPETRAELSALIQEVESRSAPSELADLADRFCGLLQFGTAGLRGELGAGPHRMNRVVVAMAAAGLAAYLTKQGQGAGLVVIGYDARHKSEVFARDTAELMAGAGFRPLLMPRILPTPLVPYAVRQLGAVAGVMVTASHNPPRDNGYKVYLGDGCQIVSPADQHIATEIAAIDNVAELPRATEFGTIDEALVQAYYAAVAGFGVGDPNLKIAYTPLHGVGAQSAREVLTRAGFAEPAMVSEQVDPDPDFPTVSFPNPEEPGAMDLVLALGARVDADVVIANDPDADRCAVAVPTSEGFRVLRGDEIGVLLGAYLVRRGAPGTLANTIVSSSLLSKIAAAAGRKHVETLTGFKWIGRVPDLAFGYEEALGYCVDPARVGDKDGISALLMIALLVAETKAEGRNLIDLLDELAAEHGLHATDQLALRVEHVSQIQDMMSSLRATPPTAIAGLAVLRADDLAVGSAELPPTDGLRYYLAEDTRVIIRPSGTEPKLKCYLETVVRAADESGDSAQVIAAARLSDLKSALSQRLVGKPL